MLHLNRESKNPGLALFKNRFINQGRRHQYEKIWPRLSPRNNGSLDLKLLQGKRLFIHLLIARAQKDDTWVPENTHMLSISWFVFTQTSAKLLRAAIGLTCSSLYI